MDTVKYGVKIVDGKKQCKACKEWKPLEEYHPRKSRPKGNGLYSYCRACAAAKMREWYAKNKDRHKAKATINRADPEYQRRQKGWALKSQYGIELEDYEARLAAQGGCCAICRKTDNGKRKYFTVDHSHTTGAVRGLLCSNCNLALGHAFDNTETLARMIAYLQEHADG